MAPPPPFPSWILRGLGDEPLLVQTFDAPREPEWEILDPMFVLSYLDDWLTRPVGREILHDVYRTLFGPLHVLAFGHGEEHRSLRPALRTAFERMDLIVLIERRPNAPPPGKEEPGPGSQPKPKPQKTFIEIQLAGSDGKPVAGERCVVTLPGGEKVTRTLDENGFTRIDDIEPGTCDVEFPDIDGREWGRTPFKPPGKA